MDRIKIKKVHRSDCLLCSTGVIHQIDHQSELPGLIYILLGMLDVLGEDMR